jgi:hypothetical protein
MSEKGNQFLTQKTKIMEKIETMEKILLKIKNEFKNGSKLIRIENRKFSDGFDVKNVNLFKIQKDQTSHGSVETIIYDYNNDGIGHIVWYDGRLLFKILT